MSHSVDTPDALSSDHGLRLQSRSRATADLDIEAEGECGGLGGCEGAADEMDEGWREGSAGTGTQAERRSETPIRMPVFDWTGTHNTFEWILQQAARVRVERELQRISRRR